MTAFIFLHPSHLLPANIGIRQEMSDWVLEVGGSVHCGWAEYPKGSGSDEYCWQFQFPDEASRLLFKLTWL